MPLAAGLLLVALVLWLAVNFEKAPAYFFTISFIGLTNGAVYALVALGYTLVYGILELINFAHGDVFMLGGMISATMVLSVFNLHAGEAAGPLVLAIVCSLLVAMVGLRPHQRNGRADRLPAAARSAATCAVDHRDRHVVHPARRRDRLEERELRRDSECPAEEQRLLDRRRRLHVGEVHRRARHAARPARADLARAEDAAREGDAGDRTGSRRRRDDGHQRQPDDLLHVPDRGALAGAGGLLYALYFGQVRYDTGFQLGLIAFTAAVLGGIGNLPGAVLGALCIGFIQAYNDGLQVALAGQ